MTKSLLFPALLLTVACAASWAQKPTAPPPTAAAAQAPPAFVQPNGPHLEGEQVTLPLVVVKGYPFIEGTINGKRGKLLFDVGDASELTVNSHVITPAGGVVVGKGSFGSGQTFEVMRFPQIDELTLPGALHYAKMTNIRGNPGLPLEENITPDFIGWIGIEFWKGYVFKLDYAQSSVTFYRSEAGGTGERAAEAGEEVVQTITAHRQGRPYRYVNFSFPVKVGNIACGADLDTGGHTSAWMTDEQIELLKKAGTLSESKDGSFVLSGLTIDGRPVAPMPIEVLHGTGPLPALLPQRDALTITLGYEFLSRFKTVWDCDQGTLTLLKK